MRTVVCTCVEILDAIIADDPEHSARTIMHRAQEIDPMRHFPGCPERPIAEIRGSIHDVKAGDAPGSLAQVAELLAEREKLQTGKAVAEEVARRLMAAGVQLTGDLRESEAARAVLAEELRSAREERGRLQACCVRLREAWEERCEDVEPEIEREIDTLLAWVAEVPTPLPQTREGDRVLVDPWVAARAEGEEVYVCEVGDCRRWEKLGPLGEVAPGWRREVSDEDGALYFCPEHAK